MLVRLVLQSLEQMRLSFCESMEIKARPESVWCVLAEIGNMQMFSGFGPIPGVVEARWIEGDGCRAGASREVRNRDGSMHREEVVVAEAPRLLEDRIHGFTSPFRFLVREARDRFELRTCAAGTQLQRTFSVELRSLLVLPFVALLLPLLRRAIRRHNQGLRSLLER